ncbi:hypothetical protein PACTADRAFT_4607 [Pachysolen tannophilus NRRL Y-2460]|uniref:Elongation of fatty acids protein n=1 Tax=Pachysolen tannophilus NRRL Y-2460 TaxID=669874 RepID=A0A1E4TPM1_PACTA|nr:hypothetical protein PACTADRAFT_4607 [Pachysolen tannophilus NRRL Y-2460]
MDSLTFSPSIGYPLAYFKILPNPEIFKFPSFKALPLSPFNDEHVFLNKLYVNSLDTRVPFTIAIVYFTSVYLCNKYIRQRQLKQYLLKNESIKDITKINFKKLPPAPFKFAKTKIFKIFVILHNIFLCGFSIYSFIGMTKSIYNNSHKIIPNIFELKNLNFSKNELFWQSICNLENGIWSNKNNLKGLAFYSFWFYISKFYEILDTIIILAKGKQSSILQSYHHSGAMISMWAGVRFSSPPIWVFVVFNSFIHTIMYFYFTLSCLHIRVPTAFKKSLTSMQICQFVSGISLALSHIFVNYYDNLTKEFKSCISDGDQAAALWINVIYLTPLTILFGAFYVESYKNPPKTILTPTIKP